MTRDSNTQPISQRVVRAVAEETRTDPSDLPPLYETVDPDCLDRLFRADPSVVGRDAHQLTFRFAGCRVTVSGEGTIAVTPAPSGSGTSFSDVPPGSSTFSESPDD